jgi:hypothetical protein
MSSQVRILFPPRFVECKIFFLILQDFENPVRRLQAGVAQLVERQPSKLQVAGSSLVSRSVLTEHNGLSRRSSGVEYFLGKEGVTGSIPVVGSIQELLSKHIFKLKLRIFTHGKSNLRPFQAAR